MSSKQNNHPAASKWSSLTFGNQSILPRLPIPSLQETADRYLKSLLPIVTNPKEFALVTELVKDFIKPGGVGETLQSRLIEHDNKTSKDKSWLEDWWLSLAYLTWREPLLVHSNWFIIVQPGPEHGKEGYQIKRAAGFISNFLDYKAKLDEQKLEPETTKAGPLCMHQYTRLFGITRVPKPGCDILVGQHPTNARHIIVIVKDQLYAVDVYDSVTGGRISIASIQSQLALVLKSVNESSLMQPPIGIFTGTHRDNWTKYHGLLESLSSTNTQSFDLIESALFVVALDEGVYSTVDSFARNVFHSFNGRNRWFDKALSIVVTRDGMIGLNGEHSPCDALVPAMLVDYAVKNEPATDPKGSTTSAQLNQPKRLLWVVNETISQGLKEAQNFIDNLIADSDLLVLHYKDYGADFIKKRAQVSPDAYVQICLQLAFYRAHKTLAPTYETASTRKYLHGRTETCRSLSNEMAQFVKLFDNPDVTSVAKYSAFKKAASAHVAYLIAASDGKGVDRHLLGLRLVLKHGETLHSMFTHPSFKSSGSWILSTSALFSGERVWGTGFGCVEPHGYGMNYLIANDIIKVGIESKTSSAFTSTSKYRSTLAGVFTDIRKMVEEASPQTKL